MGSVSLRQLQNCGKNHDDDADLLRSIVPSTRLKDGSAEGKRDSFKNSQALQSAIFKTCVVALGYPALDASFHSFVSASITIWYGIKSSDLCSRRRGAPWEHLGGIKEHTVGMAAGLGLGCDVHVSTQGLIFEHKGVVVFPLSPFFQYCCLEEVLSYFITFVSGRIMSSRL